MLTERFIKYTKIGTTAVPGVDHTPSSPGQIELGKIVADDLREAGALDVEMTKEGFVFCTIPENLPGSHPASVRVPTIGFLAHLDTATEAPGSNVKARLIENYNGGEITYPANPDVKLTPEIAPQLKHCIGHTIITTDGTTLLGADDKAGIAVLVEFARHLRDNPSVPHGKIRIAIVPDEEISSGVEQLDLKKYGVDVAYTLDGGEMGEIDVESFNGFMGTVTVSGNVAFPGYGKGIYLNAIQVLAKFISAMDDKRWPQNCAGREPIWWIHGIEGEVAKATARVFLRDFDLDGIAKQQELLQEIRRSLLKEYPKVKIEIDIKEGYRNYKYLLEKDPRIVSYAEEAMKRVGIEPKRNYVRGGNDCCRLCAMGLLSTNLFVGMQNMHSLIEWISVQTMEASLKTVVSLAQVWVDKSK